MAALRPGSEAIRLHLCRSFSGGVGRLARERGTERRDAASSRVSGTPGDADREEGLSIPATPASTPRANLCSGPTMESANLAYSQI